MMEDTSDARASPSIVQKHTLFILAFSRRWKGGRSFL